MTETATMNLMDAALLGMESERILMHMGGASVFKLPKSAPPDFVGRLYQQWSNHPVESTPFNYRLSRAKRGRLLPNWEVLDNVDLRQHFYHVRLPYPGDDSQLVEMISQLHSTPLDRVRPLWEIYLIEGLSKNRFALYSKIHHGLVDGVRAMRIFGYSMYSSDPREMNRPPVWAADPEEPANPGGEPEKAKSLLSKYTHTASDALEAVRSIYGGVGDVGKFALKAKDFEWPDFNAPDTIFNRPITSTRETGTVSFPFSRVKQLSKSAGCTINDLIVTVCGGALREFLMNLGQLPKTSLVCQMPIALNKEGNDQAGNMVTGVPVALGTNIAEVDKRFDAVLKSIAKGKATMSEFPPPVRNIYTAGLAGLIVLEGVLEKRLLTNPVFNLIITNVPGNRNPQFLNGAEMITTMPIALLIPGIALNITVTSMSGQLCLGFTSCPDAAPEIHRLGPLLSSNFAKFEAMVDRRLTRKRSATVRMRRRKSVPITSK